MSTPDYSFQEDAVNNIVNDLRENPNSRLLVVIPTGGGKTITALKSINSLIESGLLKENDGVLWATHLTPLKDQVQEELNKNADILGKVGTILKICMKTEAINILKADRIGKYKLLIIDEAHHSAANTYKEFFQKKIGILGLTATPTRNDDSNLEFDKVTYSINFRELIERGVIIKPIFEKANTGTKILAKNIDLSDSGELNKFNTAQRNEIIAEEILRRRDRYKKVIVFVGTNEHVKTLYEVISQKNRMYGNPYGHVGYIYSGNQNEKKISNMQYLKWHKNKRNSILINCKMLNEGYNDPSINAVVMGTPTRSILYYMQCVGRVVRNKADGTSNGYVLDLVDELPDINYHIDNKWLFADLSDYLEPVVEEIEFDNLDTFKIGLTEVMKKHSIQDLNYGHKLDKLYELDNISILLFCSLSKVETNSKWKFIILTNSNRHTYLNILNTLANNIMRYKNSNPDYIIFQKLNVNRNDEYFSDRAFCSDLLTSFSRAISEISKHQKVERLVYIIFNKVQKYPSGLLDFISDCYNKQQIQNGFNDSQKIYGYILKFPLPLGGYEGYYADENMLKFCKEYIAILKNIKSNVRPEEQENRINESRLKLTDVPIPIKYIDRLIYIVAQDLDNFYFVIN